MKNLLMSKNEVCERLGYSVATIDRLRKAGKLPYRKIFNSVRFIEQDIEDFINNSRATEWRFKKTKEGENDQNNT